MIKVFSPTDTTFISNGDKVLQAVRAKIRKEDNASFYIELETGLEYINNLVAGNIVVANTPQGEQAFRISNVTKTKYKLNVRADHLFYDCENYLIQDSYVVDKNCVDALNHLNDATEPQSPFIFNSDIEGIHSYRCVRKSLYEAIETVIERWGGHLVRDNFNISVMESIGTDKGITVRYAKNLQDITCDESWNDVVTKLMPVGKDGVLLPELYLLSDIQYVIPFCKTVSFEQNDIEEQNYNSEAEYKNALITDLREQANAYLKEYSIPQVSYTLSAHIDDIEIGDTVEVIDERLNISILTQVIAYEYDPVLERYTTIEFGNYQPTITGLYQNITNEIKNDISSQVENVQSNITEAMIAENKRVNNILTGSNVQFDGDKILVCNKVQNPSKSIMFNDVGVLTQDGYNYNLLMDLQGVLYPESMEIYETIIDGWTCREYKNVVELCKQLTVTGTWATFGDFNKLNITENLPFAMQDAKTWVSCDNGWASSVNTTAQDVNFDVISDVTSDVTVNVYVRGKKTE